MPHNEEREIAGEERAIYWIMIGALAPVVVGIMISGHELDAGGTLSLVFVVLGVIGLVTGLRAFSSRRLARAQVHRRSR